MLDYLSLRKNTHAHKISHSPFGHIAVWIAAVVGETTDATVFRCVDELCQDVEVLVVWEI